MKTRESAKGGGNGPLRWWRFPGDCALEAEAFARGAGRRLDTHTTHSVSGGAGYEFAYLLGSRRGRRVNAAASRHEAQPGTRSRRRRRRQPEPRDPPPVSELQPRAPPLRPAWGSGADARPPRTPGRAPTAPRSPATAMPARPGGP